MFHSLFTHAGRCFPGRAARWSVMRATTLAAITVLTLGALTAPVTAQIVRDHRGQTDRPRPDRPGTGTTGGGVTQPAAASNTTPLRAYFTQLRCLDETDDGLFSNSDEPYVVIFVADLRGSNSVSKVFFSQTFSDVDKDETRNDMLQIWSLDGNGAPISSDNDYIMLAALMESDNEYNRMDIEHHLPLRLTKAVAHYKASGMSRSAMASVLRGDLDVALESLRNGRRPYPDDRVGDVFEIIWGTDRLNAARAGTGMNWSGLIVGRDSKYQLTFRLQ